MELVDWFQQHMRELLDEPSGHAQVNYLQRTILPRLQAYRKNVLKALGQRHAQTTWGCADTVFCRIVKGSLVLIYISYVSLNCTVKT